jgi:nucleotide-binding universal stress UspA family protein
VDRRVGGPILLAIDGEPRTEAAVARALELAAERDVPVVAVHVKDPYLKQFASEIYAQGREEYLEHVDDCLEAAAREATDRFAVAARERGIAFETKVVEGDTLEELRSEIERGAYAVALLGGALQKGVAAWLSRSLSSDLSSRAGDTSVIRVAADA